MVDPRLFQALSDATRLEILSVLVAGPINVSRIVAHVGCAQPAVSRHLRVLREASLIKDKRKGKEVEYSINPDVLLLAVDHLTHLAARPTGETASPVRPRRLEGGAKPAGSGASILGKQGRSGRGAVSVSSAGSARGSTETSVSSAKRTRAEKGGGSGKPSAERKRAKSRRAEPEREEQAAPADFAPREAGYTVERKPPDMDDFLL